MVTKWGLSEKLGPLSYEEEEGEVFLGHSVTRHKNISSDTQRSIDEEVRSIIQRNYQRTKTLLQDNMAKLHTMAAALIKYETIDAEQIDDIMAGREPRPPEGWSDADHNGSAPAVAREKVREPSPEVKIGGPASQH